MKFRFCISFRTIHSFIHPSDSFSITNTLSGLNIIHCSGEFWWWILHCLYKQFHHIFSGRISGTASLHQLSAKESHQTYILISSNLPAAWDRFRARHSSIVLNETLPTVFRRRACLLQKRYLYFELQTRLHVKYQVIRWYETYHIFAC